MDGYYTYGHIHIDGTIGKLRVTYRNGSFWDVDQRQLERRLSRLVLAGKYLISIDVDGNILEYLVHIRQSTV